MITRATIDNIVSAARIEEVVGGFVSLRKRGVNLLGLCPFHDEKTPSFTVSPAKGIYKCFGCGKSGNAVGFIMEHEHYSYPEALRYLAEKYQVTIEEDQVGSLEDDLEQKEKESLFILMTYAQKRFSQHLFEHNQGIAVGLSYFRERGFTEQTIRKFGLGYALDEWDDLTKNALQDGYVLDYLDKSGLTIIKEGRQYDRFRGRVIFPIHNLTGRVIAFGARILKTDPKSPKYVNSPETAIYHKSRIVYGIDLAKKEILNRDECFLVEGYTDVISLHQTGIENVVASSGTSLTVEQIKLIGRFTKNITLLYDGDAAGIKASLRGVDLILEEGLNVKVVLFPDGDDPDSFSRKVGTVELKEYIRDHAEDFIRFKTNLLLADVAGDPVKKAGLIREIVSTIAKIPDGIIRATYIQQCAQMMDIGEPVLIAELNKIRKKSFSKLEQDKPLEELLTTSFSPEQPEKVDEKLFHQEREIIRLLLLYADTEIIFDTTPGEDLPPPIKLKSFFKQELEMDGIKFNNEIFANIFAAYDDGILDQKSNLSYFMEHSNAELKQTVGELISEKYMLSSQWLEKGISAIKIDENLKKSVLDPIYFVKGKCITEIIISTQNQLKDTQITEEEVLVILQKINQLMKIKNQIYFNYFGAVYI